MRLHRWIVAALLLTTASALAESPGAEAVPKLSPALEKLAFHLGKWTVTEKYEPSPDSPGGEGKGEAIARIGPGGQSLVVDVRTQMDPEGNRFERWEPAPGY